MVGPAPGATGVPGQRAARASAAAQLLLEHEKRNEAALRATEVTLDVLRRAGFDPQYASQIARSTLWTGITLVMSEPGYSPELPPEEREEMQRRNQVGLAMLPASKYPRLIECAAPMTTCDSPSSTTGSASGCSSTALRPRPSPSGAATGDTRSG